MGELKARERWTSEHLYKKDTYSGTFDGRKIAVLRSHTSHKTVRQSVSDVMISGWPTTRPEFRFSLSTGLFA
jgi:hypothetical protein